MLQGVPNPDIVPNGCTKILFVAKKHNSRKFALIIVLRIWLGTVVNEDDAELISRLPQRPDTIDGFIVPVACEENDADSRWFGRFGRHDLEKKNDLKVLLGAAAYSFSPTM